VNSVLSQRKALTCVAVASLAIAGIATSTATITTCDGTNWFDKVLYPQPKLIEEGHVKVDEIHTVYYHVYGNPNGKPVLFVHGGPGGGTDPAMARFFDPAIYRIILVDQRGCGQSKPFAELRNNTTWHSVKDFERIRMKLGFDKWMLFGGSWGSTLSLAYAQTYPERVTEMVLRGIFLLRDSEIRWFYQDGGSFIFPEDWDLYRDFIPENERNDFVAAYGRRLRGEMGEEVMREAAKVWSIWEGRTSKLAQDPWEKVKDKFGADDFSLAFARIENHYFTNKGFFKRDGFLLEKENIAKIRHIPTTIVQGRYDVVCPIVSAWDLKKAFPEAELEVVMAGHSAMDPEVTSHLVQATDKYKNRK